MIRLWFGVMVKLTRKKSVLLSFVNTYFSMNSILDVQCHKVNKRFFFFFLLTEKAVRNCIVWNIMGLIKTKKRFKKENSRFY